jgi:hypothetical protein
MTWVIDWNEREKDDDDTNGAHQNRISSRRDAEIQAALETAVAFSGIKASQYARIALVEKLARENFLEHPGVTYLNNRQQPEIKPAA